MKLIFKYYLKEFNQLIKNGYNQNLSIIKIRFGVIMKYKKISNVHIIYIMMRK